MRKRNLRSRISSPHSNALSILIKTVDTHVITSLDFVGGGEEFLRVVIVAWNLRMRCRGDEREREGGRGKERGRGKEYSLNKQT